MSTHLAEKPGNLASLAKRPLYVGCCYQAQIRFYSSYHKPLSHCHLWIRDISVHWNCRMRDILFCI